MSLLTVRNLTKEFGDLTAVDDASFEVADGEFVSILGPSGSGKSTILRMVAGFEEPTAGSVELAGTELVGTPSFERDVNMVFQDLALFPHLTVAENIGYGLKQSGVPADERRERVAEMLSMVRLEGYGDRDPDELSGGEQQRVALARALVNEPALVLFDEPLSSLDRKLRQHMERELQRIQSETGTTFLYVTHDQEVALSVSDRLVVLNDGEIEQAGPVEELYDHPESQFVADFIGDVNAVDATVVGVDGDDVVLDAGGQRVRAVARGPGDWREGDAAAVCVRPHEIDLRDASGSGDSLRDAPGSGEVPDTTSGNDPDTTSGNDDDTTSGNDDLAPDAGFEARGTVRGRSYQGSDTVYEVETPAGDLTATVRGGDFAVGDAVTVSWDAADAHLFPGEGSSGATPSDDGPASGDSPDDESAGTQLEEA